MTDMNFEQNRLRTFEYWPYNAPVSQEDLARQGFYATGTFLEAKCHWCSVEIKDWEYGDQVEEKHRQAQPLCLFLIDNEHCGNVPILSVNLPSTSQAGQGSSDIPSSTVDNAVENTQQQPRSLGDLFVEANRLATFKNWPNPNVSPQSLAKAGFFYLNRSDEVKCAWCKGVIAKWEKGDNAFNEHQRFFPNCPRVVLGPLIEMASNGIRELGIQQISPPMKPKYSSLDARLRTYENWPITHIQRPEALAQAGLYYQNIEDQVRCFHCNIGLRSWQKEDDPWFEHAKWYPDCQFVQLVKGSKYIQEVKETARLATPDAFGSANSPSSSSVNTGTTQLPKPMTIDEAMQTVPVLQALEIGLDVGSVRSATQRQLEETGRPFCTVEALAKAIFGDDDEDDEEITPYQSTRVPDPTGVRMITNLHDSYRELPSTSAQASTTIVATADRERQTAGAATIEPSTSSTALASLSVDHSVDTLNKAPSAATVTTAATATSEPPKRSLSLEEENRQLKEARLCKVCLDEEVGVVFLPCGHLVTCVQCAPGVNQCPLCRTEIKGFVRTFLA